jgi:hypothetical protein
MSSDPFGVYFYILEDYRRGELSAEEAAQEILEHLGKGSEWVNQAFGDDTKPVFVALERLMREKPPSASG